MPKILINRACSPWPRIRKVVRRAVRAAVAAVLPGTPVEIGILLTDNAAMRHLNHQYRHQDQATNVLSFALEEGEKPPRKARKRRLLGDVVLAYETIFREAQARHIPLEQHVTHLVVHGVLHLLGYDHARSAPDAQRQESKEIAILAGLGMANPYGEPDPQGDDPPGPAVL